MSQALVIEGAEVAPPPQENHELTAAASVPWVAIAFAVHLLLVVVAWFILPLVPTPPAIEIIRSTVDAHPLPPEPERQVHADEKLPVLDQVDTEVTETQLTEIAPDPRNEDNTNSPNRSLAEHPNPDVQPESPSPHKNFSTSIGLAGGMAGGPGGGGDGGMKDLRTKGKRGQPRAQQDQIEAALQWLADHQNIEGYWSASHFGEDSRRTKARRTYNLEFVKPGDKEGDKGWGPSVDVGLTGLSLLAFTASGFDHRTGKYTEVCRRGVLYLRRVQSSDGCYGGKEDHEYVYNHAIATMAMCELYAMSQDVLLRTSAENAVRFILSAQNPGMGWRYGVRTGDNDSSVTGWMVLALKTARDAGITFDIEPAYEGASKWLDAVTAEYKGYPRTGYNTPAGPCSRLRVAGSVYDENASMDAINMMTRLFMGSSGWSSNHRVIQAQASVCADDPPVWKHNKLDFYYWYYASLAMYQVGGSKWERWARPMMKTLMDNQRGFRAEDKGSTAEGLDEHGSWDAVDAWSSSGGRVYATAINCLTLQVWFRYERMRSDK